MLVKFLRVYLIGKLHEDCLISANQCFPKFFYQTNELCFKGREDLYGIQVISWAGLPFCNDRRWQSITKKDILIEGKFKFI